MANSTIREVAVLWLEERIEWVEHSLRDGNSTAMGEREMERRRTEHEALTYLLGLVNAVQSS